MKQQVSHDTKNDTSKFWKSFFDVLSGSSLYAYQDYRKLEHRRDLINKQSDIDSLRGDWQKIGGDFRVSISKAKQTTERT